jgi:aminomethyltransferase
MATSVEADAAPREHERLGARMVPFAGYAMPVQYPTGIVKEHHAVRSEAGLFDVSHMGEFEVRGPEALDLVQHLLTNDASKLERRAGPVHRPVQGRRHRPGRLHRLPLRRPLHGGRERGQPGEGPGLVRARPRRSSTWSSGPVRGVRPAGAPGPEGAADPRAAHRCRTWTPSASTASPRARWPARDAIISRTGYTGEDGFELYLPGRRRPASGARCWRPASRRPHPRRPGRPRLPAPRGRLHPLRQRPGRETRTPLEANLGWVVKLDKGDFIGRDALARQKEEGLTEKLVGFVLKERGFPRHGYEIRYQGEPAGEVTSGVLSHSTGKGIGWATCPSRPRSRARPSRS